MTLAPKDVIVQDKEPIAANLDDEVVMLSARAESYFGFDRVGSDIWNMIAEPSRIADVCAALVERYEAQPQTIEADVLKFLNELQECGLIRVLAQESER